MSNRYDTSYDEEVVLVVDASTFIQTDDLVEESEDIKESEFEEAANVTIIKNGEEMELQNYLKSLRSNSARINKISRLKKMIFCPTNYKATDFFPLIRKF